ncbi:hypothetical protein CRYUN_Cryun05aG0120600 [Craigia yunnanensis]
MLKHIVSKVILTLGSSRTVLEFLCCKREEKIISGICCGGCSKVSGASSCKRIGHKRFTDHTNYRLCSFCHDFPSKHGYCWSSAVMANGGVIAPVGLNMVSLAAQKHAVPFVVLAGSHKVLLVE